MNRMLVSDVSTTIPAATNENPRPRRPRRSQAAPTPARIAIGMWAPISILRWNATGRYATATFIIAQTTRKERDEVLLGSRTAGVPGNPGIRDESGSCG